MSDKKFSEFTLQTSNSNVAFVVGFNGSDNVRISPSNLIGSGFLPTSGGTMTGNLLLQDNIQVQVGTGGDLKLYHNATDSFIENQTGILKIQSSVVDGDISFLADNGSGTPTEYLRLDGGDTRIKIPDNINMTFGAGGDLQLSHDATDSLIRNYTGDLKITNFADDKDIIFQSDDGSGGVTEYFRVDGSNAGFTTFPDSTHLAIGTDRDFRMSHDGTDTNVFGVTGDIIFTNYADDKDIIFRSDDGSGGTAEYFKLDGGTVKSIFSKPAQFIDNTKLYVGSSNDFEMYHATNTYLNNNGTGGHLYISNYADDKDIIFQSDDGSGGTTAYLTLDGSVGYTTVQKDIRLEDNVQLELGNDRELTIYSDGSNGLISNQIGDLVITNAADDKDIIFQTDDGSGGLATYFFLDGSQSTGSLFTKFPDNSIISLGDGSDCYIRHDGTNTRIDNSTGNLKFKNSQDDGDIIFECDDGSGGTTEYFRVDGQYEVNRFLKNARFNDSVKANFGTGDDLQIYHDATNSNIVNETGDLLIEQKANDGDIKFYSDDGSGNVAQYFRLDGGSVTTQFLKTVKLYDNVALWLGDNNDLQIYHDGSNSYIKDAGTGFLIIQADAALVLQNAGGEPYLQAISNGAVQLYHDNSKKFETTSSGVDVTGRMAIDDGNNNVSIGDFAGDALSSGTYNVAVGRSALSTEDGHGFNVAVGAFALLNQNAGADAHNVAVGYAAGENVTTGTQNTLIGGNAGDALTTGTSNIALGYRALTTEDTGSRNVAIGDNSLAALNYDGVGYNTAVGFYAGAAMTTATANTIIGGNAGDALTTGGDNVAVGYNALSTEDTGTRNTAIGRGALQNLNYNGNGYNTAVGYEAGNDITTGIQNTLIGALAGDSLAGGSQNVAVGMYALSTEDTHGKNVAVGYSALVVQNAGADAYNVAVGYNAGGSVTTAIQSTIVGANAGDNLTTGSYNTVFGYNALSEEDTHGGNTAIGRRALMTQNAGADAYNTAVGYDAGLNVTTGLKNNLLGGLAGDALTTGSNNVAIGYEALTTEDTGSRNIAIGQSALGSLNYDGNGYNIAVGHNAGVLVTTGVNNTLIGGLAGDALNSGSQNIAVGTAALSSATTSANNIAIGADALGALTTSARNVAIGTEALNGVMDTGTNTYNVAIGYQAGNDVTTGTLNTIVGGLAGKTITTGTSNVLMGYEAGEVLLDGAQNTLLGDQVSGGLTSGSENTYIGRRAASFATTGSNNLSIGAGSSLSSATVSNEANIFNGSVVARFQGAASAWTFVSDERDKKDIEDLELGLDFIDKLKPRKFKWDLRDSDTDKGKESSGFIAQEIKEVLDETGVDYTGIVDTNNPDQYTVAQANIIPMLVKAIQELKQEIQQLKNK